MLAPSKGAPMSISVDVQDQIALITLDRAPVNALDLPTMTALIEAVAQSAQEARALVIAGRPGAFSAGIDLKAMLAYGPEEHAAMLRGVNLLCLTLIEAPVPTVAAVTGHALGGGLIIVATCDRRIGVDGPGVYALPEVRAGIPFPRGAMGILRHALPPVAARRLGLCDERVDAREALRLGLVDQLVAPDALLPTALAEARRLAALPARVLTQTRTALYAELVQELSAGLAEQTRADGWVGEDTTAAARGVLTGLAQR